MLKFINSIKVHRRTQRETAYSPDKWSLVEKWAQVEGFNLIESAENRRLYKKKVGWLMPPAFLELARARGNKMTLEAWVKADAYLILSLMSHQTPEIRLDRGGLAAALPRSIMRKRLNLLLEKLNLPRI